MVNSLKNRRIKELLRIFRIWIKTFGYSLLILTDNAKVFLVGNGSFANLSGLLSSIMEGKILNVKVAVRTKLLVGGTEISMYKSKE